MDFIRRFLVLFALSLSFAPVFAQWQVTGGLYTPYVLEVAPSTGLSSVYLVYGDRDLGISFTLPSSSPAKAYRYQASAVTPEPIVVMQNQQEVNLVDVAPGYGYLIEQDGRVLSYIWLIDYAQSALAMRSLQVDASVSDCYFATLIFDRTMPDLYYMTINGQRKEIERDFKLDYQTLQWQEEAQQYIEVTQSDKVIGYATIQVEAPFVDTSFRIVGDQFLRFWGIEQAVESDTYNTSAITGQAFATQLLRENGNELDKQTGSVLGGSAPVEVEFSSYVNEPIVTYQAWELSADANFEVVDTRFYESDFTFSFEDEGTTYVRFVINNAQGDCEKEVARFEVSTIESSLEVPNVFTPQSQSGSNTQFKVAYKSLIEFEGIIYNRWGNELFRWNNPAQGWDGKYNGKYVPTGAYYYYIRATGVGGKEYKLKGDINVLNTSR